jgi:hypothetical protein
MLPLNTFYWKGNSELSNSIPVEIVEGAVEKEVAQVLGYLKDLTGGEKPLYSLP